MKNNTKLFSVFGLILILALPFMMGFCQTTPEKPEPKEPKTPKRPTIVAVIDTGFDFDSKWGETVHRPRLCKFGHSDFTGQGMKDQHGHGTHVAGVIGKHAKDANYCLVILKFYDMLNDFNNMPNSLRAFQRAVDLKVDIINYSGGGEQYSEKECTLVKKALDSGITIVAAAGNEHKNINLSPYYPAMCDSRVIAVANVTSLGFPHGASNFTDKKPGSRVLAHEMGVNIYSLWPNEKYEYMTGTSQSAAIRTGKIVKDREKH